MAYGSGGGGFRRPDPSRNRVGLFVDFEDLRFAAHEGGGRLDAAELAARLQEIAREEGRLLLAAVYADWTDAAADPRPFRRAQMETRLVTAAEDEEADGWLPLSLDVLESLYVEPRLDVYVVATGTPQVEEVLRRLRRQDRRLVLCASGQDLPPEAIQMADRFVRLEEVLGPGGFEGEGGLDFERYDWSPFVQALDWHEKRMEFIGIGLLLKKILDHRNCGYTSYGRKREIFEKAKEDGIIEIYTVPNIEEGADPVSACRLCRDAETVRAVLGAQNDANAPSVEEARERV